MAINIRDGVAQAWRLRGPPEVGVRALGFSPGSRLISNEGASGAEAPDSEDSLTIRAMRSDVGPGIVWFGCRVGRFAPVRLSKFGLEGSGVRRIRMPRYRGGQTGPTSSAMNIAWLLHPIR